ncbi:hypothetical protein PR001_g3475 [Phytophthora rubi]|uniref:Uncharacterized protein n=1 Tax=Phytophthora rubi TaxID=129364 RepID=A0A6A3P248_9STRA|nr:hypothetical protein PR001_g3475 [Phytophthora rubi]
MLQRLLRYTGAVPPHAQAPSRLAPLTSVGHEFSVFSASHQPASLTLPLLPQYSPLLLRAQTRGFAALPTKPSTSTKPSAATPSPSTAPAPTPAEAAAIKKKIAAARRRRSKIRVQEEKLESELEKGGERRMIRVEDVEMELPKAPEHAVTLLKRTPQLTMKGVKAMAHALQVLVTDPAAVKAWLVEMKGKAKHELDHYWLGTAVRGRVHVHAHPAPPAEGQRALAS